MNINESSEESNEEDIFEALGLVVFFHFSDMTLLCM